MGDGTRTGTERIEMMHRYYRVLLDVYMAATHTGVAEQRRLEYIARATRAAFNGDTYREWPEEVRESINGRT